MTAPLRRDAPVRLDHEEFARLLEQHERGLRAYVLTMMPDWSDADEIFQATCVRLWQERGRFEVGSNFGAWAAKVAYYEVLTFRKQRSRERLTFSNDFVDVVGAQGVDLVEPHETRQAALAECLASLAEEQRELIRLRYAERRSIASIAAQTGKSIDATYKTLSRLRRLLHECVERKERIRT